MSESARRAHRAARPGAEALEGRMLLSRSARMAPSVIQDLQIVPEYVSPQSGEVDITVTRSPDGAGRAQRFSLGTTARPVVPPATLPTGWWRRSNTIPTTGRDPSALPIVPIDGAYQFEPGQTSLTIPLRLNPNYVPPGEIHLSVFAVQRGRMGPYASGNSGDALFIVTSPDRVRPEIVSSGHSPQAITLTFSKPMDPATVEDINNYQVTGDGPLEPSNAWTKAGRGRREPWVQVMAPSRIRVTLESAAYDPATLTVTLTPTEPLTLSGYSVFPHSSDIPHPSGLREYLPAPGVKPLTDLQGNTLFSPTLRVGS